MLYSPADTLLLETIQKELDVRVETGETPSLEEFRREFPGSKSAVDLVFPAALGPYRVVSIVGQGSFGRVYRALHPETSQSLAIKVLEPGCQEPDMTKLALLANRRLIVPFERGVHRSLPRRLDQTFLVMPFVEGRRLSDYLDDFETSRYPPLGRVLDITLQLAEALLDCHRFCAHLDLKPDNILIDPEGGVHVADFGLAQPHEKRHGLTWRLRGPGTMPYMSPEQLRPWLADADDERDRKAPYLTPQQRAALGVTLTPSADIWGIGVILYQLLTLDLPFGDHRNQDALYRNVMSGNYLLLSSVRPELPAPLCAICDRCLKTEPRERFPSASDLADALRSFSTSHFPNLQEINDFLRAEEDYIVAQAQAEMRHCNRDLESWDDISSLFVDTALASREQETGKSQEWRPLVDRPTAEIDRVHGRRTLKWSRLSRQPMTWTVVLGDSGSGKTSLLWRAVCETNRQALDEIATGQLPTRIAVYLNASKLARHCKHADLGQNAVDSLCDYITLGRETHNGRHLVKSQPTKDVFGRLIAGGHCLIALDAIDRVDADSIEHFHNWLTTLGTQVTFLCSSGLSNYQRPVRSIQPKDELEVLGLDAAQIRQTVRQYYRNDVAAENFLQEACKTYEGPTFHQIFSSPLLLHAACSTFSGAQTFTRRVELFERLLSKSWGRFSQTLTPKEISALQHFSTELAYELWVIDPDRTFWEFSGDEYDIGIIADAVEARVPGLLGVRDKLEMLRIAGILACGGSAETSFYYYFTHRIIGSYLAAKGWTSHLAEDAEWQELDRRVWLPSREQVILFLAGLLDKDRAFRLLSTLADEKKDDIFRHRLCLACMCLPEFRSDLHQAAGELVGQIALRVCEHASPYSPLQRCLPALGTVDFRCSFECVDGSGRQRSAPFFSWIVESQYRSERKFFLLRGIGSPAARDETVVDFLCLTICSRKACDANAVAAFGNIAVSVFPTAARVIRELLLNCPEICWERALTMIGDLGTAGASPAILDILAEAIALGRHDLNRTVFLALRSIFETTGSREALFLMICLVQEQASAEGVWSFGSPLPIPSSEVLLQLILQPASPDACLVLAHYLHADYSLPHRERLTGRLIELSRHSDSEIRLASITALVDALESENMVSRQRAILNAVLDCARHDAVQRLRLMAGQALGPWRSLLNELGLLGDTIAIALDSRNPYLCRIAAATKPGDWQYLPVVLENLRDPDPFVREATIASLDDTPKIPEEIRSLVYELAGDYDAGVVGAAVRLWLNTRSADESAVMAALIRRASTEANVRSAIIALLRKGQLFIVSEDEARALAEPDNAEERWQVRLYRWVAMRFVRAKREYFIGSLLTGANDACIRALAAASLWSLGLFEIPVFCVVAFADRDTLVRQSVLRVLQDTPVKWIGVTAMGQLGEQQKRGKDNPALIQDSFAVLNALHRHGRYIRKGMRNQFRRFEELSGANQRQRPQQKINAPESAPPSHGSRQTSIPRSSA